jgi:uncharacterized repeat protein (TIGR01451 family)
LVGLALLVTTANAAAQSGLEEALPDSPAAAAAPAPSDTAVSLVWATQKVEAFVNDAGEAERRLVDAKTVVAGDELRYTITFTNNSVALVEAGSVVITNPIPVETAYLEGTATGSDTVIEYSLDGENFAAPEDLTIKQGEAEVVASATDYKSIRWVLQSALEPGAKGSVSFGVLMK